MTYSTQVYTDDQYEEDPILHYEAPVEKEEDDEEEVFGERRTEERRSMMGEEKSPTRDILKHRMRGRGDFGSLKKGTVVDAPGSEDHSDFGKPAFFEEEEDPQVGNSVVDQGERLIVDVFMVVFCLFLLLLLLLLLLLILRTLRWATA